MRKLHLWISLIVGLIVWGVYFGHVIQSFRRGDPGNLALWFLGALAVIVLAETVATGLIAWLFRRRARVLDEGPTLQAALKASHVALMILVIVAPLARGQKTKLAVWLDARPIRYVGEISLSAYLWHFPMILVLGRLGVMAGDDAWGMWRNVVVLLAVTIAVASITYYGVEKPVMKWAKALRKKKVTVPADPELAPAGIPKTT